MSHEDTAVKDDFLEKAKFFRDHVQGVLTLATGSLVLSVTFLHDLGTTVTDKADLSLAWKLLGLAVFFGLMYNYVLAVFTARRRKAFGVVLGVLSFALHGFFFAGLIFLAFFGLSNLK